MPELNPPATEVSGPLAGVIKATLRRAVRTQSSAAKSYVAKLREHHPGETPAEIRARLDSRFLALVTGSGLAVGASAAVPGVGTVLALGAVGAESFVFLEAAAFYTLAVAEVHGVDVRRGEHEELLVMTIMLGASDTAVLSYVVGTGGSTAATSLGIPGVKEVNRRVTTRFLRRFAVKRATLTLGKLAPAGIGAAVGAWGNRKLGRTVLETAHATFGAPPEHWAED